MKNSIFRSILIGLLVGLLAFFAIRFFIILLIIGAIFKLAGMGKGKHKKWHSYRMAHADNIRSMSEEEYESFKTNEGQHNCHR